MKNLYSFSGQSGQALVTLLFFCIIALTITTASVVLVLSNSIAATSISQADIAYSIAESGAENATLRLLRDPSYTGETLAINGGLATIQVSGPNPYNIISSGEIGNFKRTISATVSYTNNTLTVTSWKESY